MTEASRKASGFRRSRSQMPSGSYSPLSVSPSSSVESLLTVQSRPRPLKVVIIGPASVGKTALRQRYFTKRFQRNYKATIGTDFEAKVVQCKPTDWGTAADSKRWRSINGKGKAKEASQVVQEDEESGRSRKILLTVWDTAGQERFRALGSAFYRGADAVIVCFDASSQSTSEVQQAIQEWHADFTEKSGLTPSQNQTFCWIAVGCKIDLREEGAVRRRQVRQMLNRLVTRSDGIVTDGGTQTGGDRQGDEPPADPKDVLSRAGIHEEDDFDPHIAGDEIKFLKAAKPKEGNDGTGETNPVDKSEVAPSFEDRERWEDLSLGRDASAESQDKDHEHLQTSSGMMRGQSDAAYNSVQADQTLDKSVETSQNSASKPFPSFSTSSAGEVVFVPSRTPPAKKTSLLRLPSPESNLKGGTAPLEVRSRYDSNISMASSSHLSVYHTPRNSQMYATSSSAAPTETGSLKTAHSLGHKSFVSTLGKESDHTLAQRTEGHDEKQGEESGQLPRMSLKERIGEDISQPTTTKRTDSQDTTKMVSKSRSLSIASVQTLPESRARTKEQDVDETGNLQTPVRKHLEDLPSPPQPLQGFSLFYTSSLDGTNVQAVFEHIISRCSAKWEWEEYTHRMNELQAKRRSRFAAGGAGVRRRRSIWGTIRWRRRGNGEEESDDDQDRIGEETRRMVRVSDGKGDSQKGGCC